MSWAANSGLDLVCKSNSVGMAGVRGMTGFFEVRTFPPLEVGGSCSRDEAMGS